MRMFSGSAMVDARHTGYLVRRWKWLRVTPRAVVPLSLASVFACPPSSNVPRMTGGQVSAVLDCPDRSNAGLSLPPDFCANVFADSLGAARHLTVAANGDVFVSVQRRPTASGVN